jgi:uridine kinase
MDFSYDYSQGSFFTSFNLEIEPGSAVAIVGSSGAGKTTLVNALRKVFPYDSNLVLETDRYHKWERHHTGWKTMTHLNPEANLLEKMQDDTYRLKLGEQIQHVDYDHATGTFTEPQVIDSKNYVFLCGLHTLFQEEMRSHVNLKVYVDTEKSLKRLWKIQRDMKKRGYTFQQCDEIFREREADFEEFILPQKQHADMIIQYYTEQQLPTEFSVDFPAPPVNLRLETSPHITAYIHTFLEQFCDEILLNPKSGNTVWFVKHHIAKDQLLQQTPKLYRDYLNPTHLEDSYLGLLQALLVMILIDPSQSKQTTVKAT